MSAQDQVAIVDIPAVVVFGRDDGGKPHASSFIESEASLAQKAAHLMGMRVLAIKSDAERALAAKLPRGKIFASGKGFVPFVKGALYAELELACPGGDPVPLKRAAAKDSEAGTAEAKQSDVEPAPPAQPKDWDSVEVGAIVLAAVAPKHVEWFECQVTAIRGGDLLTLRYCDWPNEPTFVRHRTEVGLVHPSRELEPPAEAAPQASAA